MKAIVVADRNWGIGKDGDLLVHLPGDLKYFKKNTLGKTILMGRKTLESLPGGRPLPGRDSIILSRSAAFAAETERKRNSWDGAAENPWNRCKVISSLETLLEDEAFCVNEDVMVAGGGEVYRQCLSYCDCALVTKLEAEFPADCYFENLDESPDWELTWESETQRENGVCYRFTIYRRRNGTLR